RAARRRRPRGPGRPGRGNAVTPSRHAAPHQTRGFQGRETMMRRTGWLTLGLALTAAAAATPAARAEAADAPKALGTGPAYQTLARLPVLHVGRVKPFDTLAREEVKQIFGRETIKVQDPSRGNKVVETWGPVAAAFDWSVRPEVWDDSPIILVEYVPLK